MTRSSQAGTQSHVSGEAPSRVTCHVSPRPSTSRKYLATGWCYYESKQGKQTIFTYSEHIHMVHISLGGGEEDPVSVRVSGGGPAVKWLEIAGEHLVRTTTRGLGYPPTFAGGGLGRTRQSRGPLYPRYICPSVSPPRPHPAAVFDWFSYIHYKPQVCNVGMAGAGAGAVAGCGGGNVEI